MYKQRILVTTRDNQEFFGGRLPMDTTCAWILRPVFYIKNVSPTVEIGFVVTLNGPVPVYRHSTDQTWFVDACGLYHHVTAA